ncbi:hypothetical protein [Neptuniibacter halophilus]|uniref:hypothetical protein n=1 Tax=Neptuniibacter halophilus TaxID=651666 RepID=UPI0025726DF6|nr:hypothetical protein [Neptuniibacter halophilus]
MSKKHMTDKLQARIDKEGLVFMEESVRFTVTHTSPKGKLLGRDWHKGDLVVTSKRLLLVSEKVKYLNIKSSDERFSATKFFEDNVACLEVDFMKDPDSKRSLVFHIYTPGVDKLIKLIEAL